MANGRIYEEGTMISTLALLGPEIICGKKPRTFFLNISTNLKGEFTLEQAMKAQRVCEVIAPNILLSRR
jgi:hypothetical protein